MTEGATYLTEEGAEKVRTELAELKGSRREELANRLRFAIGQGDLSENADYTAAKEEQAFLEGRIQELESLLRRAEIVPAKAVHDQVAVGATVVVAEAGRAPEIYEVVGVKEADPRAHKISYQSPIGAALMGLRVGEVAHAETPGGKIQLKILEIR